MVFGMFDTDCVRVEHSKVCAGFGVFATRFIPTGNLITRYHGVLCGSQEEAATIDPTLRYNMEYGKEGAILVGESDVRKCESKGVAQLVNDAVSVALHGRMNNCCFVGKDSEVWLKSLCPINSGEELLAGYGIDYWQSELLRAPTKYTKRFQQEIMRNSLLISRLQNRFGIETFCCSGWSLSKNIRFSGGLRFQCPTGIVHEKFGYVGLLKARSSKNGKHFMDFVCDICGYEENKVFTMPILRKLRYARVKKNLSTDRAT